MSSRFETLPKEIQQMVSNNLKRISDIKECILVCNSWKHLHQGILYTSVELHNYSQLAKFLDTLDKNRSLSGMVKKLAFKFDNRRHRNHGNFVNIANLFSHLLNLEYINFSDEACFSLLSNALLENQLTRLNYVTPPKDREGYHDYATCAILLKDRLTNLKSPDSFDEDEEENTDNEDSNNGHSGFNEGLNRQSKQCSIHFYRLFDKLHQFKYIKELYISQKPYNTIDTIEEVTSKCPLLQKLHLDVFIYNHRMIYFNDATIKSPLLPAFNVNHLTFRGRVLFHDSQIVQYIIEKFPRLHNLTIGGSPPEQNSLGNFTLYTFLNF